MNMKDIEKFARKCSVTNKGMNEGYCFGDGEFYCISEEHALEYAKKIGYKNLNEAFYEDEYYFTEWEELDDDCWYDEDGNEFSTSVQVDVKKLKRIDDDNIKLSVSIDKDGKKFKTTVQYVISSNSVHHSDSEFEVLMEENDINLEQIMFDIESRKIKIC